MKIIKWLVVFVTVLFLFMGTSYAAQQVNSAKIHWATIPNFTAGQKATVSVRIQSLDGSGNVILECDSKPSEWSVSPKNRNPTISQGTIYDYEFTVTPPDNGGSGSIVWKLYDDDWGRHPTGSHFLASKTQSVSCPAPNRAPYNPSNLRVDSSSIDEDSAKVCWNNNGDPDGDTVHFRVEYGRNDIYGDGWTEAENDTTSLCEIITGLVADKPYDVRVQAFDKNGGKSDPVKVNNLFRTDPLPPEITKVDPSGSSITLQKDQSKSFKVDVKNASGGTINWYKDKCYDHSSHGWSGPSGNDSENFSFNSFGFHTLKAELSANGMTDFVSWTINVPTPDLVIVDGSIKINGKSSIEVLPGDKVNISWSVKNQGGGNCGSSKQRVFWTKNNSPGNLIAIESLGSMNAGQQHNDEPDDINPITIPSDWVAGETYYIGVIADCNNDVDEAASGESNNDDATMVPVMIKAIDDAEIVSFDAGAGFYQYGDEVTVSVDVKNIGTTIRFFWVGLSFIREGLDRDHWPEGWYDVHPVKTSSLSPGQREEIDFTFKVNESLRSGLYYADTAVWDGYNTYSNRMVEPRFAAEREVRSFDVVDERPGNTQVRDLDETGLFSSLSHASRLFGLTDLGYHLTHNLEDTHGVEVMNQKNVVVLMHGWNPTWFGTSVGDPLNEDEFDLLTDNLENKLPNDWSLVHYAWEDDANTTFIHEFGARGSSRDLLAQGVNRREPAITRRTSRDGMRSLTAATVTIAYVLQIADKVVDGIGYAVYSSAGISAEKALQHGSVLGYRLCQQNPNLKKVHLIAHSAGSWGIYAALRYLSVRVPNAEVQVTYLDPFIPGNTDGSIPFPGLDKIPVPGSEILTENELASSVQYASAEAQDANSLEVLYSYDALDKLAKLANYVDIGGDIGNIVLGILGKDLLSLGESVSSIMNVDVDMYPTAVSFNWNQYAQADVFRVTDTKYGAEHWCSHSGPIIFYAGSVAKPDDPNYSGRGWVKSMAYNQPQGKVSLTVSPNDGVKNSPVSVSVEAVPNDAVVRYTKAVNNVPADPTDSSSVWSDQSINGNPGDEIAFKFKGFKFGWTDSAVVIRTYKIVSDEPVETPSVSPGSGEYSSPLSVSTNCPTAGATIRYTTNGSEPTSSSPVWSNHAVTLPITLKFKAFKSGWMASTTVTRNYTKPGPTYTLTVNSGSGDGPYEEGTSVRIMADAPPSGQMFDRWTVSPSRYANRLGSTISSSTTFTMPAENATITANFAPDTHTITASASTGGAIAPSGSVKVGRGQDQVFTITPADSGYFIIDDVIVDGSSVGAVATYKFTAVTVDHSIEARFIQCGSCLRLSMVGKGSVRVNGTGSSYFLSESELPWLHRFDLYEKVQLEAVDKGEWSFSHWSGDLSGNTNPTTITMNGSKNITFNFKSTQSQISLDMDPSTRNYDDTISSKDIEPTIAVPENGEVWVAVVAQGVTDLDTYQVEVSFNTEKVEFIEGVEENPSEGIENLLKKNGGETVGFQAVETIAGTINIANALTYTDCDQAPEGTGILALLKFRVLDTDPDNYLTLGNVFFIDCNGSQQEVTNLTNGSFNTCPPWDFTCDGIVNYLDLAIFADHWLLTDKNAQWDAMCNLSPVADAGDQIINYLDLAIFADHWLEETP
jgi:hypothetical protein